MDKAEYKEKLDKINELAEAGDFAGAAEIVDDIDWRHVKSVRTLCMVGEIYEANKRYDDAIRVLKYAYKRSSVSKTVLYRLVELSVKTGDPESARIYAKEFKEVSPNDTSNYILRYKICRVEGRSLAEQIKVLEDLKDHEYSERWAYELARLYFRNGQQDKCLDECDDMILWFSEGRYVTKAMELKMQIRPLTPAQQKKYDMRHNVPTSQSRDEAYRGRNAGFDNVSRSVQATDEEDSEKVFEKPILEVDEAIDLMDAAADKVVVNKSAGVMKAASISLDGNDGEKRQSFTPDSAVQTKLADSIRAVLSGAKDDKAFAFEGEAYSVDKEAYSENDINDYVQAQKNQTPSYNVPTLEPESIKEGAVLGENGGVSDGQMTIEDFKQEEKEAELDLKALFSETTANLASAIASGDFSKTAVTEEDDAVKSEDTAEEIFEEDTSDAAISAVQDEASDEEAPVLTVIDDLESENSEELYDLDEADGEGGEETVEAVLSPSEHKAEDGKTESHKAESSASEDKSIEDTGSLGLTREFNFHEELEKAMVSGVSMAEAARRVSARASEEAAQATEEITRYGEADDQEIPAELFADEQENSAAANLGDLSSLTDEFDAVEESRAIIDNIMDAPERFEILEIEPRKFTDVEKKTFSYFAPIPGVAEQVTQAIADVHNNAGDKTSRSGNVVVIGRQGSGKTRLADAMILAICSDLKIESAKIAHIIADDFNKKDAAAIVARMAGGFLVIEGAGALSEASVEQLSRAMEFRTDDLVVILEDEKPDMQKLLDKYPEFAAKFTSQVVVPVFTNDELVTFGRTYCKELGYKMDEMAILALYTLIGDNQKDREPVTVGRVQDMIDTAIERNEKAARRFGRRLSKRELDSSGRIMLHEKDFNF